MQRERKREKGTNKQRWMGPSRRRKKERHPKLTTCAGAVRQQPPYSIAKGRLRRPLHLHRSRGRRPQDLFHPILRERQDRLAEHVQPQRRHQADPGHDHWRVEHHRELRQGQVGGYPVKNQGSQLAAAGYPQRTGLPESTRPPPPPRGLLLSCIGFASSAF